MKYLYGYCLPVILFVSVTAMEISCKGKNRSNHVPLEKTDTSRCGATIPRPTGCINDFVHLFTPGEQKTLDSICTRYSEKGYGQIALVTMDSIPLQQCDIKDYATDLGNNWGVGNKSKDDGIVIVISISQRQIAIANGYGTEKILSDQQTKNIIDSVFIPSFKKANFFEGCYNGLLAIDQFMSRIN